MSATERVAWACGGAVCISIGALAAGALGNAFAAVLWSGLGVVCEAKALLG